MPAGRKKFSQGEIPQDDGVGARESRGLCVSRPHPRSTSPTAAFSMPAAPRTIPFLLRAAAIVVFLFIFVTAVSTYVLVDRMTADGRVVNYAGIVRGGSQRLVKLELADKPADALIKKLDGLIDGLIAGSAETNLPPAHDGAFLSAMQDVRREWQELRKHIDFHRANPDAHTDLLAASERYFETCNRAVAAAEIFAKGKVTLLKRIQLGMVGMSILFAIALGAGLTAMIARPIKRVALSIASDATQLASASSEVARASHDLADNTSSEAAALEETSASVEEITSMIRQSAEHARNASKLAATTQENADAANSAMSRMQEAHAEFEDSTKAIGTILRRRSTRSLSRRISSRSTPRSRPPAPARPAPVSPSSPRKFAASPSAQPKPPRKPR